MGTYQMNKDKDVLFGVLDFYKDYKYSTNKEGKRIGSEAIAQQTSKTLNQIGELKVLSYFSQDEIYDLLKNHLDLIKERAQTTKERKVISRKKIEREKEEVLISFTDRGNAYFSGGQPDYDENIIYKTKIKSFEKGYILIVYKNGNLAKVEAKAFKPNKN